MLKNHILKNIVFESYKLSKTALQVRLRQKLARSIYRVCISIGIILLLFLPLKSFSQKLIRINPQNSGLKEAQSYFKFGNFNKKYPSTMRIETRFGATLFWLPPEQKWYK